MESARRLKLKADKHKNEVFYVTTPAPQKQRRRATTARAAAATADGKNSHDCPEWDPSDWRPADCFDSA